MAAARTVPARDLAKLNTVALIDQYDRAISSHAGRYTNTGPRQARINRITDMLAARADAGDPLALAWFDQR